MKETKTTYMYKQAHQTTKTHVTTLHTFNGPFSGTTQVSQYQKGKTNLDFTEARDSEWQWHQLGHMQVCTSLQIDNHASTPPLRFLQAGCPSCRPTNSIKALKALLPKKYVKLLNNVINIHVNDNNYLCRPPLSEEPCSHKTSVDLATEFKYRNG